MSNLKRHVKSDRIKWIATAVVLLLISLTIVGVCLQVFGKGKQKPSEWFKKNDKEQSSPAEREDEDGASGEMLVSPGKTNPDMTLSVKPRKAANGVSEQSDNSYTVTAVVKDANNSTENVLQDVTWEMTWNGSTAWNTDNLAISHFVNMSVDGSTVTLDALHPFQTQINLICTCLNDPTIQATATLDYRRSIKDITVFWDNETVLGPLDDATSVPLNISGSWTSAPGKTTIQPCKSVIWGKGTVDDTLDITNSYIRLRCSNAFRGVYSKYTAYPVKENGYTINYGDIHQSVVGYTTIQLNVFSGAIGNYSFYSSSSVTPSVQSTFVSMTNELVIEVHLRTMSGKEFDLDYYVDVIPPVATATSLSLSSTNITF